MSISSGDLEDTISLDISELETLAREIRRIGLAMLDICREFILTFEESGQIFQ